MKSTLRINVRGNKEQIAHIARDFDEAIEFVLEVLLKPDEIILTNNAGMSVELSDKEGIKIISNKEILIKSEEAIDISSTNSELQIFAPNAIVLNQGSTQMKLSDNLVMKGARVQME